MLLTYLRGTCLSKKQLYNFCICKSAMRLCSHEEAEDFKSQLASSPWELMVYFHVPFRMLQILD